MKKRIIVMAALVLIGSALFAQTFRLETYNNSNSGGDSSIEVKETTETINGKAVTVWVFSGKLTRSVRFPFAGCKIIPDAATLALFRNAKGVSFMSSGDGRKYRVKVITPGGGGNNYGDSFTAAKGNGKEVKLEYGKMKQDPYWGEKKDFIAGGITELEVQFANNAPVDRFEFRIWDFKPLN